MTFYIRQSSYQFTLLPCHGTDLVTEIFKFPKCHRLFNLRRCGNFGEGWFLNRNIAYLFIRISVWLKVRVYVYMYVQECVLKVEISSAHSPEVYIFHFPKCCNFFILKCLCQACCSLFCCSSVIFYWTGHCRVYISIQ